MTSARLDLDVFARAAVSSRGCWNLDDMIEVAAEAAIKLARDGIQFTIDGADLDVASPVLDVAVLIDRRIGAGERAAEAARMERLRRAAQR